MRIEAALEFYEFARSYSAIHFAEEVEWQRKLRFASITESDFLRESAWVIFCSGFKEKVLRGLFSSLSLCFCDWESARVIDENRYLCQKTALEVFKNSRKVDAILDICRFIGSQGFEDVKLAIQKDPINYLQELPYIGPITSWHLAKNIGFDLAKPDRHLVNVAETFQFLDVQELCSSISARTGDKTSVVDLVLWRYCAEKQGGWPGRLGFPS
jgi:hypothetical protein